MGRQILVIDDNTDITQIVSVMLRGKGYEVLPASGGTEALKLLEQRRPDLILCDILMPDMDGFQVFQAVRADRRWRAIPFAFMTALTDEQTRLSSSELGAEAFITKPFTRQELLSVVAGILRRTDELQSYTLDEVDSFKAQLLFMITHELNTPLSVIRMLADSMRNNLDHLSRERLAEYMELLSRSVGDLSYVIESMLLALQIDSGRAARAFDTWGAPLALSVVLDTVAAKAKAKAAQRQVRLRRTGFEAPIWVAGHEEQLQQVFGRILNNAITFSPAGETVTVSLRQEGGRALASISDHGPGMTQAEVAAAFERFRQINREQQEQQGIGLSLSLVRALVEIHGGEIIVDSTPGRGSSFTVALPLTEPAALPKRNGQ